MSADAMIVRGSLLTMDRARPRAEAMAVAAGRIVAVGGVDEARAAVGEHVPVLDLGEATVLPGLIDSHNHMLWTGLERRLVDLRGARDVAETLQRVEAWARAHPDAPWVLSGEGWHVDDLAERRYPKREELDRACPDRPVFLGRGGHAAATNSRALAAGGVGADTPDPPGGRVERDERGEPTGVLVEWPARELVARHIPPPSPGERLAALRDIQPEYLAAGLTRVQEPGLEPQELATYQELQAAGELTVRVTAMPLVGHKRPLEERLAGFGAIGVRTGFGDGRLRLGGLKVYFDGAASFGTAYLREDWPDRPGYRGELVTSVEQLGAVARFCAREHWSLGVHVVGGGGLDLAIQTFEEAGREHPILPELRFTLIHAYLWPSADNMTRARELGLIVATQPTMQERFAPLLARQFGWERLAEATPLRSWRAAEVTVAGGSDSPITPYQPLRGIWQAVTRHLADRGGTLGAEQCLPVEDALELYTHAAARACFCEHEGVLRPGARGDWIALAGDPLAVDPAELRDLPVLVTASGGEIVHDARNG